jgi:hypothetical protein
VIKLAEHQIEVIQNPVKSSIFLEGPAGTGKTTTAVERLLFLMENGVPGETILVLVPQRTLSSPYWNAVQHPGVIAGGEVTITTFAGIARRMIDLFWPEIAEKAGFCSIARNPTFLTLETAQYFLSKILRPLLREGLFESVTLERNRLFSQILDNLNKSALVGFHYTEIGSMLETAWSGDPGQKNVYDDVQKSVNLFREYCLENSLLDYSLQVEIFHKYIICMAEFKDLFTRTYKHMIIDNIEEDTPVTHKAIQSWSSEMDSHLLVYDSNAGFRIFLGADPDSAYELKGICQKYFHFGNSFVSSREIDIFNQLLTQKIKPDNNFISTDVKPNIEIGSTFSSKDAIEIGFNRYFPEMLDWSVELANDLIRNGTYPGETVIIAPYVSDSLVFMLSERLVRKGIPFYTHRPSRSLRDEPVIRCLLTFTALSFPDWDYIPSKPEVINALITAIKGIDLVRANLLTKIVYRDKHQPPGFSEFGLIKPDIQERITFRFGEKYEQLRIWLQENQASDENLDVFISRLFGEILTQPGFGLHLDINSGQIVANFVESIRKFRWAIAKINGMGNKQVGKEFFYMVQEGVIAAQYVQQWQEVPKDAVYIAPAYTFLMHNRPVDYQIWLDVGSRGWHERLNQPLTQPYVLSRTWERDRLWTDKEEFGYGIEALNRLTTGLIRRCRKKVFFGICELNERGFENQGPFLSAIQRILIDNAEISE